MLNKRIFFVLLVLAASVIYSLTSLTSDPLTDFEYAEQAPDINAPLNKSTSLNGTNKETVPSLQPVIKASTKLNGVTAATNALPITFALVGTQQASENKIALALLEFEGDLYEHTLNDLLFDYNIRLLEIHTKHVVVEYKKKKHNIALTLPNLLAPHPLAKPKTHAEFLAMTPKEIGMRPRIMEHLFTVTPTPYIADAVIVSAGLNPDIFDIIGFQEDDLLQSINGKSVTISEELEALKVELKTAHQLTFKVMRKGRLVTLYLDIPSEALEISR